jgi:hypothetical protein
MWEEAVKGLFASGPVAVVLFVMLRWALGRVDKKDDQYVTLAEKTAGVAEATREALLDLKNEIRGRG